MFFLTGDLRLAPLERQEAASLLDERAPLAEEEPASGAAEKNSPSKTDVSFSENPEVRASDSCNTGLFQQGRSELLGLPAGSLDVGKCIKRTERCAAGNAGKRVEAIDNIRLVVGPSTGKVARHASTQGFQDGDLVDQFSGRYRDARFSHHATVIRSVLR